MLLFVNAIKYRKRGEESVSKQKMQVIAARFPKSSAEELEKIAEEEQVDKSTVIARALHRYIKEWKLEKALTLYRKGKVTLWKAAGIADISLWEIMDIVRQMKIPVQYMFEDFREDFEAALKEK
jgi:predicted HTH domain antitoxin